MKLHRANQPITRSRVLAAGVSIVLSVLAGQALAADGQRPPALAVGQPMAMDWTDLRVDSPAAAVYRRLWSDRMEAGKRRWASSGPGAMPFPAFSLSRMFDNANPPVLVSFFFSMYDCELPGNGPGADLYSKCPLRIATGAPGAPGAVKVTTRQSVCMLNVPPIERAGDGPSPSANYTTVSLDADRTLHVRVVQFGKPVKACDNDFKVE